MACIKLVSGSWGSGLLQSFNTMRLQQQLCDVKVSLQNGQTIRVHSTVLAAASPFLKSILLSAACSENAEIDMHTFPVDIVKQIMEFLYTGRAVIKRDDQFVFHSVAATLNIAAITDILQKMNQDDITKSETSDLSEVSTCYDTLHNASDVTVLTSTSTTPAVPQATPLISREKKRRIPTLHSTQLNNTHQQTKQKATSLKTMLPPTVVMITRNKSPNQATDSGEDCLAHGEGSSVCVQSVDSFAHGEDSLADGEEALAYRDTSVGSVYTDTVNTDHNYDRQPCLKEEPCLTEEPHLMEDLDMTVKEEPYSPIASPSCAEDQMREAPYPLALIAMPSYGMDRGNMAESEEDMESEGEDMALQSEHQTHYHSALGQPMEAQSVGSSPPQYQVVSRRGGRCVIETVHPTAIPETPPLGTEETLSASKRLKRNTPRPKAVKFVCDICNRRFTSEAFYERHRACHRAMHTENKRYRCYHCDYSTNYKHMLKEHERSHTGQLPYECKHCHKSYSKMGKKCSCDKDWSSNTELSRRSKTDLITWKQSGSGRPVRKQKRKSKQALMTRRKASSVATKCSSSATGTVLAASSPQPVSQPSVSHQQPELEQPESEAPDQDPQNMQEQPEILVEIIERADIPAAQVYTSNGENKRGLVGKNLVRILLDPILDKVSRTYPIKPRGGEVYVIDFRERPGAVHVRGDNIRWRQDKISKFSIPCENEEYILEKMYSYITVKKFQKWVKCNAFKKYTSYLSTEPLLQVIEYIGDQPGTESGRIKEISTQTDISVDVSNLDISGPQNTSQCPSPWIKSPALQSELFDQLPADQDQLSAGLDQLSTNSDQLFTNPDQLSPNPDQLSPNPDQLSTNPDQLPANPDQLSTNPDQLSTDPVTPGVHVYLKRAENKVKGLTVPELENILRNPVMRKLSTTQPIKPRGGEVYVVDFRGQPERFEDTRADMYRWRQDRIRRHPTSNKDVFLQKYYDYTFLRKGKTKRNTTKEFKKYRSFLSDEPLLQVVEYIGDEKLSVPFSHGNSKNSNSEYYRTAPSVLQDMRDTLPYMGVAGTYRQMVASSGPTADTLKPRNKLQVGNMSTYMNRKHRKEQASREEK